MSRAYLLGALHDGTVRKRTIRICQREERYVLLSSAWCSRWEPVPGRIARGRLAISSSRNSRDLCLKVPLWSVAPTKSITREAISTLRRELLSRGLENLAVPDVEDAIGDVRDPSVVGDNDDGLLEILVQSLEQVEDFLARLRVELSCGLVREKQGRIVRQGDRDGDPLLLAAAQLVRPMARTLGEADEIKEFLRPSLPGRAVFGGEAHRQLDVLLSGQRRDEVEELEDEARLSQSIPNEFSVAEVDEVGSVHLDPTRGRAVDPAQDIQEGRLAAPRRPSNRNEFAVIDVHVEAAQRDYFRFPRSIDFDQILRQDSWHVYPPRNLRTRPMSVRTTRSDTRKDVMSIAIGAAARSRSDVNGTIRKRGTRLSPPPAATKVVER